ncbi:ATP-binding protein [Pelosinus sp. sgz500959]|uniref:ATP-binding protein n=1 Tax=Pelosinus sp. sgz500959 TaxID=3242472 RepID=UPI00366EE37B
MKNYDQLVKYKGNSDLFRAIEMSITALSNDIPLHIHAEGVRGTGKTTIMRSVKEMLPPILRIKNCIYNCHPEKPHCPEHRHLSSEKIGSIGTEVVPCPFLEISHAAKIGTVIGSIDLGKLTSHDRGMAAILPGTIPQAHRGVIFIDEINRLADVSPEVADVLLDVMGTKPGHVQIEETGLPTVELPVSVAIWAASNPDEEPGPLNLIRKQLADRFDFSICMERPKEYTAVFNILAQRTQQIEIDLDYREKNRVGDLGAIMIEDHIRNMIAKIYVDFNLESLRSIETMELSASLSCLMAGRQRVEITDLINIVPFALNHRVDKESIEQILNYLECGKVKSHINLPVQELLSSNKIEKIIWWKNILNNLYQKMNFLNKYKSPIKSQMVGSKNDGMPAGNLKMMDPAKTDFIAPPHKALAMRELPVEEFIKHGEQ